MVITNLGVLRSCLAMQCWKITSLEIGHNIYFYKIMTNDCPLDILLRFAVAGSEVDFSLWVYILLYVNLL